MWVHVCVSTCLNVHTIIKSKHSPHGAWGLRCPDPNVISTMSTRSLIITLLNQNTLCQAKVNSHIHTVYECVVLSFCLFCYLSLSFLKLVPESWPLPGLMRGKKKVGKCLMLVSRARGEVWPLNQNTATGTFVKYKWIWVKSSSNVNFGEKSHPWHRCLFAANFMEVQTIKVQDQRLWKVLIKGLIHGLTY